MRREGPAGDVALRAFLCSLPGPRRGPAPSRCQAPRIAEGPLPHRLGSRRRAPALAGPFDGGRPCIMSLQARNGGGFCRGPFLRFGEVSASRAALRALPASFRAAGSLAGPVLLAACVGGSVWAPSRAFLRRRGSNNLTVVARVALCRRSAVSKGLRPGCPPL